MYKNKTIVNVYTSNNDKNYSRIELLQWINDTLSTNLKSIEQLKSGLLYCQLFDMIFRKVLDLNKIKSDTVHERHYINNYKILQSGFVHVGIIKDIPIMKLVSGSFKANYEFLKWFRKLYKANSSNECICVKSNNVTNQNPELAGEGNEANGNKNAELVPVSTFKGKLLKTDIVKNQQPVLDQAIIKTNNNNKVMLVSSLRHSLKGKFTSNIIKNQKPEPTREVNETKYNKKALLTAIARQKLKSKFLTSNIVKNQKSELTKVANKANDNIGKVPDTYSKSDVVEVGETNDIKETMPTSVWRQLFEENLLKPDFVENQKPKLAGELNKTNDKNTISTSISHHSLKYLKAGITKSQKAVLAAEVNETNSNKRGMSRSVSSNPSFGVLDSKKYNQELDIVSHTSDCNELSCHEKINAN